MRGLFALLTLVSLLAIGAPAAAGAPGDGPLPPLESEVVDIQAPPPDRPHGVSDGALRSAISEAMADEKTVVEVVHNLSPALARGVIEGRGGEVLTQGPGNVIQARLPLAAVAALEAAPGVQYVRTPLRASVPASVSPLVITGQEVGATNADDWHAAGYLGAGVKVGIIDFFDGVLWAQAQAAGEVPAPAGTFCSLFSTPCNVFDPALGDPHGIAVSEIVHEMAPEAEIYIAFTWTTADTQAAVDYFASQGVDIISRSLTATYDGPGDGTGPLAEVVDSAVSQGMVWVNSAGNSASSSGTSNGSYWRGTWNDPDNDGFLNFNGADEVLGFYCGFLNGLRWNDWDGNATDYDVLIFDTTGDINSWNPKYVSVNDQTAGFDPLEIIDDGFGCSGPFDVDYLVIQLYDPGNGVEGDILELMGNGTPFEYSQNPYSATGPATDSASPGMMAVGAMAGGGGTIATYSSQGPTNDGRMKPDLTAASCVNSYAYAPDCFAGTSASAPAVAGATALVMAAGLADTPAAAKTWVLNNATADLGAPGGDNVYGAGELVLPAPPPDADGDAIADSADNCPNWHNPGQSLPPWPVANDDPDCDGFSTADEIAIGTAPFSACAQPGGSPDAWPPDHNLDGVVSISDLLALKPYIAQTVPPAPARMDLVVTGTITISDVLAHKPHFSHTCSN